jgi:hypothetical protein
MPETDGSAALLDLDVARMEKAVGSLSNSEVVQVMLGLHSPTEWGSPMLGGATAKGATATRVVFTEIAMRWIPLEVYADAFAKTFIEEASDDA